MQLEFLSIVADAYKHTTKFVFNANAWHFPRPISWEEEMECWQGTAVPGIWWHWLLTQRWHRGTWVCLQLEYVELLSLYKCSVREISELLLSNK